VAIRLVRCSASTAPWPVVEHERQVGLAGQSQRLGDADLLAEAGLGVAGSVAQLFGAHADDELRRCAGVGEFGAPELNLGQVGERVVHPLANERGSGPLSAGSGADLGVSAASSRAPQAGVRVPRAW
jgi:hypothetical protein